MTLALPFTRPPAGLLVDPIVRAALEEDLGRAGDVTSELTIPAGQTATAFTVTVRGDRWREPDERLRLTIGTLAPGIRTTDGTATGLIRNDD